jgi:hypothetical protein
VTETIIRPWQGYKLIMVAIFVVGWTITLFVLSKNSDLSAQVTAGMILIPCTVYSIYYVFKISSVEATENSFSQNIAGSRQTVNWTESNVVYKGLVVFVSGPGNVDIVINTALFTDIEALNQFLSRVAKLSSRI